MHKTTGQVIEEAAEKWPERPFIISMHQKLERTFKELNEDANRLANALLSIGVTKGDRVGLWSPNSYEWTIAQFGVVKIGAILVNINPAYRKNEFIYGANLVGLSTLISCQKLKSSDYVSLLESVSPGILKTSSTGIGVTSEVIPTLKNVIYMESAEGEIAPASYTRFGALIRGQSASSPIFPWRVDPDDVCNIQFTSGTTGNPKGASLTHHGTVNNAYFVMLEYVESKTFCVPCPFYHCMGSVLGTLAAAILGNTIVIPSPIFTSATTLAAIEAYKCDAVMGTPTMYIDLINQNSKKVHNLSSIECIYIAGSICSEKTVRELRHLFPKLIHLVIPYGTTEASPAITVPTMSTPDDQRGTTIGSVIDHAELKIVNPETGHALPRGQTGEIWTRSVFIFPGYWNQPAATAEVIDKNGWYKTGDLAYMTDEEYICINGRIKDLIIRGGENVYPREIEGLICQHEAVRDVNVIGVGDERLGEEITACVILKEGYKESDELRESIKSFCKEKISYFKIPKYIIFLQQFPQTVTFKVQKNKLKQIAEGFIREKVHNGN